jgi:NAD(P)-dependent dehydrogenase (short-subunit alcohol dehydrogenase family)
MSHVTLAGKRAVVTGVTGNVGWGVAKALLERGASVIAITRSAEAAATVAASLDAHPKLQVEVGDLSRADSAMALGGRIAKAGRIDHVVASLGAWWQKGLIVEQTAAEYEQVRAGSLDAQVFAAMAFLPQLRQRQGATYTMVTGAGGHMTIPSTGLLVIAVSGVFGLSRMLRAEHSQDAVRVNEVLIKARIEREARPGVVPAVAFGAGVATLLAGATRGAVVAFDATGEMHQQPEH